MFAKLGLTRAVARNSRLLIIFHDHAMLVVVLIVLLIGGVILGLLTNSFTRRRIYEEQRLEVMWTVTPALILFGLAVPSLQILYLRDEIIAPIFTVKCIGHQWYWSYEYSDGAEVRFDSYIIPTEELDEGGLRLLDVDNRIVLPVNEEIRLLVSSTDVIHRWTVPVFGVKLDAIPGRLNEIGLLVDHVGVFYGQCSEICGANHSYMPIVVEVLPVSLFEELIFNG